MIKRGSTDAGHMCMKRHVLIKDNTKTLSGLGGSHALITNTHDGTHRAYTVSTAEKW